MTDPTAPFLLRDVDSGGPGIGDWFCVTVVRPAAGSLSVADVVRRLGGAPSDLQPWDHEDLPWPEDVEERSAFLLSETDGAVVVVEPMGFQGIRHEVLAVLSAGAEVTSLQLGVNGDHLAHARDGEVLLHVDTVVPYVPEGEVPAHLAQALAELVAVADAEDWERLGDASVGALVRLGRVDLGSAWWAGPQQLAVLDPLPDAPPPPPTDLQALLAAATAAARQDPDGAARRFLGALLGAVRTAADATGLTADAVHGPAVAESFAACDALLAVGLGGPARDARERVNAVVMVLEREFNPPEHARMVHRGRGRPGAPPMEQDPLWQRFQAGVALGDLVSWCALIREPDLGPGPDDVLLHTRLALADRWPAALAALAPRLAAVPG